MHPVPEFKLLSDHAKREASRALPGSSEEFFWRGVLLGMEADPRPGGNAPSMLQADLELRRLIGAPPLNLKD